jgi:hypothetical protein
VSFHTLSDLVQRFKTLGATRVLFKRLAENDNSKQQIYLGNSFEVLQQLPYKTVRTEEGFKRETFKADLDFRWLDSEGHVAQAPGAQLILYPKYPEVRLSGFLRGCAIAPRGHMRPIPRAERASAGPDGRVLFLATTPANTVLAYLALRGDKLTAELNHMERTATLLHEGVFVELPLEGRTNSRDALLKQLRRIHAAGWHESRRLDRKGVAIPYTAPNGGGYTLEALFGIIPNGISAPDFQGWELKAYSSNRVTLMTPEPDSGYYGDHGVEAFLRKYGRRLPDEVLYFTGTHRAGTVCEASGQMLVIRGFDLEKGKIGDVSGGLELRDGAGNVTAAWSFSALMQHWGRKHGSAAYVKYEKRETLPPHYRYLTPALLGEGTDFIRYLSAIGNGRVVYDPGCKLSATDGRTRVKARSQFRVVIRNLGDLYHRFETVSLAI